MRGAAESRRSRAPQQPPIFSDDRVATAAEQGRSVEVAAERELRDAVQPVYQLVDGGSRQRGAVDAPAGITLRAKEALHVCDRPPRQREVRDGDAEVELAIAEEAELRVDHEHDPVGPHPTAGGEVAVEQTVTGGEVPLPRLRRGAAAARDAPQGRGRSGQA